MTGQNFQTGSGITWVNFKYGMFNNGKNITINSITPTSIKCTMVIGFDAPEGQLEPYG